MRTRTENKAIRKASFFLHRRGGTMADIGTADGVANLAVKRLRADAVIPAFHRDAQGRPAERQDNEGRQGIFGQKEFGLFGAGF